MKIKRVVAALSAMVILAGAWPVQAFAQVQPAAETSLASPPAAEPPPAGGDTGSLPEPPPAPPSASEQNSASPPSGEGAASSSLPPSEPSSSSAPASSPASGSSSGSSSNSSSDSNSDTDANSDSELLQEEPDEPEEDTDAYDDYNGPYPRPKPAALSAAAQGLPEVSATAFTLGGKPGDYLYLAYDRGDTAVTYPGLATLEVFKDDTASGNWQPQYYDRNSSGVSLFYTLGGAEKHYVTSYYSVWNGSKGIRLKDADAVVTQPDANTISVRWINSEFVLEMRYIYKPGTLSIQREYRLTNISGGQMTNIRLVYGGDTYFGGNDYGYSYWDSAQNMVFVRSAESGATFMGLSGSAATPANAYFAGNYGAGVDYADRGALPNAVTSANEDQSYYLQWNRQYINNSETYTVAATERFSIGGAVQVMSPENQSIYSPAEDQKLTYTFMALNLDTSSTQCDVTAVSSRGYEVEVTPHNFSIGASEQKAFSIRVTIPKNAPVGDDKITVTATVRGTGATSKAYVITSILPPADKTPPVISGVSYVAGTTWVNPSETVNFTVTDNVAVDPAWVMVAHADGSSVPVTQKTATTFSFVATKTGVYTITARDTSGNAAVPVYTKQINVDTTPPVLSNIQVSPRGSTSGYTSILNTPSYSFFAATPSDITLTLADGGSGIQKLEYQFVPEGGAIQPGGWQSQSYSDFPLSRTVVVPANNYSTFTGSIAVRLTDRTNNVYTSAPAANGRFVVDSTPPTTSFSVTTSGFSAGNWYTSLQVLASGADSQSGLARISVMGGPSPQSYTPAAQANGLGAASYNYTTTVNTPGIYTLYSVVTDKSGNQTQSTAAQTVKICNQPPALSLVASAGESYTNQNVTITLSNTNANVYSDISYYYKKTTDASYTLIGTAAPNRSVSLVLNEEGSNQYQFKAVSGTLVESAVQSRYVRIDRTAPAVPAAVLAPAAPSGSNGWYKTRPAISITAVPQDSGSTVSTYYKLAPAASFGSAAEQRFTGTNPSITDDGSYILEVYSRDAAGNESTHNRFVFKVDTAMPAISGMAIDGVPASLDESVSYYTGSNATLVATISDATSGIQKVYYQLVPDGQELNESGNFTQCVLNNGKYELTVTPQFSGRVYLIGLDNAGNGAVLAKPRIVSDALAPTAPRVDTGGYTPGEWTKDTVTLSIPEGSSTALSGIAGYFYTIGSSPVEYPYSVPFNAPPNDVTVYHFYAKSNTGQKGPSTDVTVMHDSTIPTFSATPRTSTATNMDIDLDMDVTFGLSGLGSVTVSINGAPAADISQRFVSSSSSSVKISANGEYKFTVTSRAGASFEYTRTISNIDKTAPAAPDVTISPNATSPYGLSPWLNEGQRITATPPAQDSGSTQTLYYNLYRDSSGPSSDSIYTSFLSLMGDGQYTFYTYVKDAAGNESPRVTRTIWLDSTAPTLAMAPSTGTSPFTNQVEYVFTATDGGSGPRFVRYTLTEGAASRTGYLPFDAAGKATLHIEGSFSGTLTAQSYDKAGNASDEQSANFVVDFTGAGTTATVSSPASYVGAWTNNNVVIDLSATGLDGLTDAVVTKYEYSTDSGTSWRDTYSTIVDNKASFTLNAYVRESYLFRAQYSYENGVGGTETATASASLPVLVQIDKNAPNVLTVGLSPPTQIDGPLSYYGTAATVTITSSDATSGLQTLEYSLDGGATFTPYTGPFAVPSQFRGVVTARATDRAGNSTHAASSEFIVDGLTPAPPTLTATAGGQPYDGSHFTNQNVILTASGGTPEGDDFSGVDHYEYSTDGGASYATMPSGVLTLSANSTGTVRVRAVSVARHISDYVLFSVKIDKNTTGITLAHSDSAGNPVTPANWTNRDVITTLSTSGYTMPVHFEYKISSDTTWTDLASGSNALTIKADTPVSYDYRLLGETNQVLDTVSGVLYNQDRVAPAPATAQMNGAAIGTTWYTTSYPILVQAPAPDGGSPVTAGAVQYSLYRPGTTSGFLSYDSANPPTLNGDGTWLLDLLTVDDAGNRTYTDTQTIKLDTAVPLVNIDISPNPAAPGLYSQAVQIVLSGSDAASGLSALEYKLVEDGGSFDSTAWQAYTGPVSVSSSFKGTVYAKGQDRAGNWSEATSGGAVQKAFTVDLEKPAAPGVLGTLAGGGIYAPATWAGENVLLSVQSPTPAPLSGVQGYEYRRSSDGGANWTDWATTSVPPLATDGQFVYEVRAINGVGRAGDVASYVVWRDAGIVTLNVSGTLPDGSFYPDGTWTNQTVRYTLSSNPGENPSGLWFYEGSTSISMTPISGVVEVVADTSNTSFNFWAGNRATPQVLSLSSSVTARVDKTLPAMPEISASYLPADDQNGWYNATDIPANTPVISVDASAQAGDTGSLITNQIDTGAGWGYYVSAPLFPTADGVYTYRVRATDAAGNESAADSLTLRVDTAEPSGITAAFYNAAGRALVPNVHGEILSSTVLYAKLTGSDDTSGMGSISWELVPDAQSDPTLTGLTGTQAVGADSSITVPIPMGFSGTLTAKGRDRAGNENTAVLYTSPVIEVKNTGDTAVSVTTATPPTMGNWYKASVNLTAYAQNLDDGLSRVVVKVNNEVKADESYPDLPTTQKEFQITVSASGMNNTVEIIAYDAFGNTTIQKFYINIDTVTPAPPVVSAAMYDPGYIPPVITHPDMPPPQQDQNGFVGGKKPYGGQWTNYPVHFSFSGGTDIPSGILRIEYSTSADGQTGWSAWETISGSAEKTHTIRIDGNYYIRFRHVSNVENEGQPSEAMHVRMDTLAPLPAAVNFDGPGEGGVYVGSPVITVGIQGPETASTSPVYAGVTLTGDGGYALDETMTNAQQQAAPNAALSAQSSLAAPLLAQTDYLAGGLHPPVPLPLSVSGGTQAVLLATAVTEGPLVVQDLPEGNYTLKVTTYDEAGNQGGEQTHTFSVTSSGAGGQGGQSALGKGPATGDIGRPGLWLLFSAVSLAGILGIISAKRVRAKKRQ